VTCDADGVPLVVCVTAANVNDEQVVPRMLDQLPAVQGPRGGRPRRKPKLLLGDRAYGVTWLIALLVSMRIVPLLAPRLGRAAARAEHGSGLGKRRATSSSARWRASATSGDCEPVTSARMITFKRSTIWPRACWSQRDSDDRRPLF
jgi:hypothetical protein